MQPLVPKAYLSVRFGSSAERAPSERRASAQPEEAQIRRRLDGRRSSLAAELGRAELAVWGAHSARSASSPACQLASLPAELLCLAAPTVWAIFLRDG